MTNFEAWKKDADMPELVNGEWVDLETGIPFSRATAKTAKPTSTRQDKYAEQIDAAKKASKVAKLKALTGTAAQKKWAVQIRFERFNTFTSDVAKKYINANNFLGAKFWIETRTLSAASIENFVIKIAHMIDEANSLNEEFIRLTPGSGRIILNAEAMAVGHKNRAIHREIDKLFVSICSFTN